MIPDDDAKITQLHLEIAQATAALQELHATRLTCRRGCSGCCVDDLTIFEVEAERIQSEAAAVLDQEPHPAGGCAFLDAQGNCRIYAQRPYVCRTQGLPLRWMDLSNGEPVEYRDICSLNEAGPPIEDLAADACWEIGPWESRLAELQFRRKGRLARVSLRDLFHT